MIKPVANFARTGLVSYLAGWLCLAPVLVVCVCPQGHASLAMAAHDAPVCAPDDCRSDDTACRVERTHYHTADGYHQHAPHAGDDHSTAPGDDHHDEQSLVDDVLPSASASLKLQLAPVAIEQPTAIVIHAAIHTVRGGRGHLLRSTGPPDSVERALASTILLI